MFPHLWIPITLIASCAQTARNATQASLTATLGPVGSAQVRFLYGLPFALLFLAAQLAVSREALPAIGTRTALFALVGASAQILATVLMLAAMQMKSFAVTTATTKTEPVLVAIFGVVMLGDRPSLIAWAAILIATAGVIIMSLRPARTMSGGGLLERGGAPAIVMGVMSGGCFAIAAICFRGAILALPEASLHLRATLVLVLGLGRAAVYTANGRNLGNYDTAPTTMMLLTLARGEGVYVDRFRLLLRDSRRQYARDSEGAQNTIHQSFRIQWVVRLQGEDSWQSKRKFIKRY